MVVLKFGEISLSFKKSIDLLIKSVITFPQELYLESDHFGQNLMLPHSGWATPLVIQRGLKDHSSRKCGGHGFCRGVGNSRALNVC